MTNFKRMLIALAAAVVSAVGLNPLPSLNPIVLADAPQHATGCTSYLYASNQARGYCTHMDNGAQAREKAVCKNLSTGQLANAYGALVSTAYTESKAVCGPNWVVASHVLIVYQS